MNLQELREKMARHDGNHRCPDVTNRCSEYETLRQLVSTLEALIHYAEDSTDGETYEDLIIYPKSLIEMLVK